MASSFLTLLFISTSAQFHLPNNLLSSVCYVESTHKITAYHKHDGQGNSVGVCQIKLKTARFMGYKGTEKQLMDPAVNVYYAGKYLAYQLKRYKSTSRALVAYNRGNAKGLTSSYYSFKVIKQWREFNVRTEREVARN